MVGVIYKSRKMPRKVNNAFIVSKATKVNNADIIPKATKGSSNGRGTWVCSVGVFGGGGSRISINVHRILIMFVEL